MKRNIVGWDKHKGLYHALDSNHPEGTKIWGSLEGIRSVLRSVCGSHATTIGSARKFMVDNPPENEKCPRCVELIN